MAFGGLFAWPLLYGGIGPSVWFLVVLFSCSEVLLCDSGSFVLVWLLLVLVPVGPYGPAVLLLVVFLGDSLQSFILLS